MVRILAMLAGAALLGSTAHVAITAAGGYAATQAPMLAAMAVGTAVGAMVLGAAWGQNRRGLALVVLLALAAGEAWGLLTTGERIVTARETLQAPLRAQLLEHERAVATLKMAEAATPAAPDRSRLAAAEARQRAADAAVRASAADKGCRAECGKLLQAAADAAAADVGAARSALEQQARAEAARIAATIAAARSALAAAPLPQSATPLADRLGLPAWAVDLASAALLAVGANALGAALLAFAAHGAHLSAPAAPMPAPAVRKRPVAVIEARAVGDVGRFLDDRVAPGRGRKGVDAADLYMAYTEWCRSRRLDAVPAPAFADHLAAVVAERGLRVADAGDTIRLHGIRLLPATPNHPQSRSQSGLRVYLR